MRPERLAVIQARDEELGGLCAPDCAGEECQAERDRRELLDMVRELQARLDMLMMACEEAEECGRETISIKGLRAAITATEGS